MIHQRFTRYNQEHLKTYHLAFIILRLETIDYQSGELFKGHFGISVCNISREIDQTKTIQYFCKPVSNLSFPNRFVGRIH